MIGRVDPARMCGVVRTLAHSPCKAFKSVKAQPESYIDTLHLYSHHHVPIRPAYTPAAVSAVVTTNGSRFVTTWLA
jgi:hypothetical protein